MPRLTSLMFLINKCISGGWDKKISLVRDCNKGMFNYIEEWVFYWEAQFYTEISRQKSLSTVKGMCLSFRGQS